MCSGAAYGEYILCCAFRTRLRSYDCICCIAYKKSSGNGKSYGVSGKYVRCIYMLSCIQEVSQYISNDGREVAGTSTLGGLCAYPVAIFLMGKNAANLAFYVYVFPFFVSTFAWAVISGVIVLSLKRSGILSKMQQSIE